MTSNRNLALGGATLLIVGLFCPIVTLPLLGNVNLFNSGTNEVALAVLGLAVLGGAMALNGREQDAFWPGWAAAAIVVYQFVAIQFRLSQMRRSMAELEGNPFAGMAKAAAGTIQLQWGWLVLALGVGLLVYAAVIKRRASGETLLTLEGSPAKTVAGVSALLAAGVIGLSIYNEAGSATPPATISSSGTSPTAEGGRSLPGAETMGPSEEKVTYIRQHLRLYDFKAEYYSGYDGRTPGVDFKIKNDGDRTLNQVTVKVVFKDAAGKPIAEEEYNPVIVSSYSIGDNAPLRPNYIWQMERGKFYSADKVPSEWKEGNAIATITNIEFGPNT